MTDQGFTVEVNGTRGAILGGELDLSTYDMASRALAPLFDAEGDVTLDMSELTFMDSSGIRLIIQLNQALADGHRLLLLSPTPPVKRILEIAGLAELGVSIDPGPE